MAVAATDDEATIGIETDVDECKFLQSRLDAKLSDINTLHQELEQAAADKAAAHEAGLAGMQAAKAQLERLRAELVVVRQWREAREHEADEDEDQWGEGLPSEDAHQDSAEVEANRTRAKALQVQVRRLRHDLACLKFQVDRTDAKRPRQEEEIIRLKTELVHTLDILDATRYQVRHHEVDQEFQRAAVAANEKATPPGEVALGGGGHGNIEAQAERHVREGVENKNIRLSGKAKRLTGVVAAQQLLIQRLEKQLVKEEQHLEQKDEKLYFQAHRLSQLKSMARQDSDSRVAKMVGVSLEQLQMRKFLNAKPSSQLYQSASEPRLPPI